MNTQLIKSFRCLKCDGLLQIENRGLSCSNCHTLYKKQEDTVFFKVDDDIFYPQMSILDRIKFFIRRYPLIYEFFRYTLGTVYVGKNANKAVSQLPAESLIINIGSGVKKIRDDIINVDMSPCKGVQVVADIGNLPFRDSSIDAVVCEFALEHVEDPEIIVKEIYRVLKDGGLVYIGVPFILGFHSCPDDYYRWTEEGVKILMHNFKELEIGVRCGPTSAMVAILEEWLASFFSFGVGGIYNILLPIFTVVLAPLKILDIFIYRYKTFKKIALGFYCIGKK